MSRRLLFRLRGEKVDKVLLERLYVKLLWRPNRVEYLSVGDPHRSDAPCGTGRQDESSRLRAFWLVRLHQSAN